MDRFNLRNITDMIFGPGKEERCGDYIRHYRGSRVLIVCGDGPVDQALTARVRKNLEDAGLYCVQLNAAASCSQYELGMRGAQLCKEEGLDFVLAAGGSKVIDTAKFIAFAARYEGDPWPLYQEEQVEEEKKYPILPIGALPTSAGAGSEMTEHSVISRDGLRRRFSYILMKPKFCILDPEMTYGLSPFETACGVAEMFSQLTENFMSASAESDLADGMVTAGLRTVLKHGRAVMSDPENFQSRSELMIAAPMAAYGITSVGRSGDGAVHAMERALPAEWDLPGGAALAALTPAWMRYVYGDHLDLFVKLAVQVFGIETDVNLEKTALAGIAAVERFLYEDLKLPRTFSELGAAGNLEEALRRSCGNIVMGGAGTVGNTHPLTAEDCFNIYMACR